MTIIQKITENITPKAKSIERQAHEAWLQYFNSHKLYLTPPKDEFIPSKFGVCTGCIGVPSTKQVTTFDDVKGEMMSAYAAYKNGNKKQCKTILDALSSLDTNFDVRMTFFKMLAEMK